MAFLVNIIHIVSQALTIIVFVDVILSYFMSPYHPVRQTLDRIVEPMLQPIRRLLPSMGGLDFSPFVLLLLIWLLDRVLTQLLFSFS